MVERRAPTRLTPPFSRSPRQMHKDPIIGIDLGTTNSCAAIVEGDGNVKLIPYKGGEYTIPSVFAIDDKGNELIGHEAKRQWQLNPVRRAVVTVPAYFTDRQRQTVKDAGKLIDLEVVRIINEPTAASLAYGIKNLNENSHVHQKVVVYDLGGGTFDVSIIEIRDRVFEVKATGGDIFLGGLDFDQAMIRYVLRDFAEKNGIDLSTDPVAMQRIKDLAERVKIDLSSREQAPFSVPFVTMTTQGQPLNIEFVFTRALLEEITEELVDRTIEILERVMRDAQLDPARVDELLLVGGQTRMPII